MLYAAAQMLLHALVSREESAMTSMTDYAGCSAGHREGRRRGVLHRDGFMEHYEGTEDTEGRVFFSRVQCLFAPLWPTAKGDHFDDRPGRRRNWKPSVDANRAGLHGEATSVARLSPTLLQPRVRPERLDLAVERPHGVRSADAESTLGLLSMRTQRRHL